MKTVIEYPAWHDEARAMRKSGKTIAQVADHFGFTSARMQQIASDSWKSYIVAFKMSGKKPRPTIGQAGLLTDQYEFKPVAAEPVMRKNQNRKPIVKEEDEFLPEARSFEQVKRYDQGMKQVFAGGKITCSKCGKQEEYYKSSQSVNPNWLSHEFTRLGWSVGKTPRQDLCPQCSKTVHEIKKETAPVTPPALPSISMLKEPVKSFDQLATMVNHAPAQPAKVEPVKPPTIQLKMPEPVGIQSLVVPIEMDRATRRIIFAKLNDVYVDEKIGYSKDWTDEKVAVDLGVDKAWIADVRDADFGPETNAHMQRASIDELIKMGDGIERRMLLIDKKIEQMQALDSKVVDAMSVMEKAVDRYNELVENLKTQDAQTEAIMKGFNEEVSAFNKKFAELKS